MSRYLNIALNVFSVVLLLAGVALTASIFVPQFWTASPTLEEGSPEVSQVSGTVGGKDKSPDKGAADKGNAAAPGSVDVAPDSPDSPDSPEKPAGGNADKVVSGPRNKTLKVTIPEMGRVKDDRVPYAAGDDKRALKKDVAIHLEGTGHPWQKEANVYLAGHRIGYPGTDSFLGFYRLDKLAKGDKVYVTAKNGKRYTYRVYRQEVVSPKNTKVTEPIDGRNILTLQTCTLPNYTQRLIVQAEKVS